MRWTYNCILLASIAVISASESSQEDDTRNKRDLKFLKNLVSANLFGSEVEVASEQPKIFVKQTDDFKLFRIPGFEKVLVKAIPKRTGVGVVPSETVVEVSEADAAIAASPDIAIVNSYLGTKRLNDTLFALQGVKNLLQSGVLEAQRERVDYVKPGAYQSVVYKPGKIVIDGVDQSVIMEEGLPIPMIEGYRPVEVMRLPDLPIPSKYSYKQINSGGVMSYTAKDNKNVVVSETSKPMPLPPYLSSRIQEVLLIGANRVPPTPVVSFVPAPPPIPVYNVPKVPLNPIPVLPTYVSSSYSMGQVHTPSVHLTPPPIQVASSISGGGYSYSQIHKDGSVTSHSQSGQVVERKGRQPSIVIAEATRPAPLPMFLTNRIEKVAATAISAKNPNSIPHALYAGPLVYREPYPPVIVEERPAFYYDYLSRLPTDVGSHHKGSPYREDVNVHVGNHKHQHVVVSPHSPSGYSYKTVHADGSVSTYSDSGVSEDGKKLIAVPGPMFYPGRLPGDFRYPTVYQPHLIKEEICLEPPSAHHPHVNVHVHSEHSKPSGFSYKTVQGAGSQATYSGSGHVEHQNAPSPISVPVVDTLPPIMVPETASPGAFFEEDFDGGKKVMFAKPVISQYVYKQINHQSPSDISVSDVRPVSLNGDVNVKVGALPGAIATPSQFLTPPPLTNETPSNPNEYIYVPPTDVNEPLPTRKPSVDDSTSVQPGHSFTHVTNDGVHTNKGGEATFEAATPSPVVKVVKTSSSTSTSKTRMSPKPKYFKHRANSTPKIRVHTVATTTPKDMSLAANPIVVLPEEQTFSFKQDRADGSSITVVGNKENVSVIEDRTESAHHRGDIPETSL